MKQQTKNQAAPGGLSEVPRPKTPDLRPGSLEYWAVEHPRAVALIEDDRELTYRDWNDGANRIANALAARGLEAGDVVVLRTHIRSEWALIASALAKLGCSLLGLNWRLTPSEAHYVLGNSGARALVCDDPEPQRLAPALEDLGLVLRVSIDRQAPGFVALDELLETDPAPRVSQGDPPLIVYTSGTTGLPKGVVMGQGSRHYTSNEVREYLKDVAASRRSTATNGVRLITMPMHHGSGPAQLWGALRAGQRIVLLRRFDPERALQLIEKHRVTDWSSVPTMLKRLAGLPQQTLASYDLSSLRAVSVGAAPVPFALKEWAIETFGEGILSEGYGSTETGMVTRLPPEMQRAKPGSSGLPYKHVSIEVRDDTGAVLPAGAVGDLWVRTPTTLGRYLNTGQLDNTAEHDNSAELDESTLDRNGFFRVGDVGYLDEDGYLYITDRAKDMIISGGVNIYPAEIEAVLQRHPAIQDAAVIGLPEEEYGERVAAFCELKPGRSLGTQELRAFVAEHLASYKRPKEIVWISELPRNTMGKVLKGKLRAPYWQDRERKV